MGNGGGGCGRLEEWSEEDGKIVTFGAFLPILSSNDNCGWYCCEGRSGDTKKKEGGSACLISVLMAWHPHRILCAIAQTVIAKAVEASGAILRMWYR